MSCGHAPDDPSTSGRRFQRQDDEAYTPKDILGRVGGLLWLRQPAPCSQPPLGRHLYPPFPRIGWKGAGHRTADGVFVGIDHTSYLVYNPVTHRVTKEPFIWCLDEFELATDGTAAGALRDVVEDRGGLGDPGVDVQLLQDV